LNKKSGAVERSRWIFLCVIKRLARLRASWLCVSCLAWKVAASIDVGRRQKKSRARLASPQPRNLFAVVRQHSSMFKKRQLFQLLEWLMVFAVVHRSLVQIVAIRSQWWGGRWGGNGRKIVAQALRSQSGDTYGAWSTQ
jgi:hypothetical protein